jgi:hypothetical protein
MTTASSQRPRLSFGLGQYQQFLDELVDALPKTVVKRPDGRVFVPLAQLTERRLSDPTMALFDAWAAVADILSFYQDWILNEGYLPTALEMRSVALLGRMLSFSPATFMAASTHLALLVEPGGGKPVTVPAGSAVQAAAGVVFETSAPVTAVTSLNCLTPLQTRSATLTEGAVSVLLQGTALGLSPGDPLLLVRTAADGHRQWLRTTVIRTKENHTLNVTDVFWGRPLASQWAEAGTGGPPPAGPAGHLNLYALRLTCRLFGYNASAWQAQSYAVRAAAAPVGHNPGEYAEWPGFGIEPGVLDLQAVYSKLLPASQDTPPDSVLLLEYPGSRLLGTVATVAPKTVSAFGMTGQTTRVTLESGADTAPGGYTLPQPRFGHTATALPGGKVLIVGGMGPDGVLDSVDVYDPLTRLLTPLPPLPAPRAFHTATQIGNRLALIGGSDGHALVDDVLLMSLNDETLPLAVVPGARLATPRVRHQGTALPDGRVMISGGCTASPQAGTISTGPGAGFDPLAVTDTVAIFDPADGSFGPEAHLQRARAGHTATLCPVYAVFDELPARPEPDRVLGQAVVFVGGYGVDQGAAVAWADAEITIPWSRDGGSGQAGTLVPALFPITGSPPLQGQAPRVPIGGGRYDHRATMLPAALGALLTGGRDVDGTALDDCWLMCCYADLPAWRGEKLPPFEAKPAFFPAHAPLMTGRYSHVAAALPSGQVVVAGGIADGGRILDDVELRTLVAGKTIPVDGSEALSAPASGTALAGAQAASTWAILADGRLFLCGGLFSTDPAGALGTVETYDPAQFTFIRLPGPILPASDAVVPLTTTALSDGTILLTAASPTGRDGEMTPAAWTFDPATGLSTATSAPGASRIGATTTMLQNGTVLLAGGLSGTGEPMQTAEIYDPRSRSFRPISARMPIARACHSATLLDDGTVLLAGGIADKGMPTASADVFNPGGQSFSPVGAPLPAPVFFHSAVRLASGDVLITGGTQLGGTSPFVGVLPPGWTGACAAAAVYNAAAGGFAALVPMGQARALHSSTLLPDGRVLVAGGSAGPAPLAATEIFDPARLAFGPGPDMLRPRCGHGAVPLDDGRVLMIGGDRDGADDASTGEMIRPDGRYPGEATIQTPVPLPSAPPDITAPTSLAVQPVLVSGRGILAFGADQDSPPGTAPGVLFVLPPGPPSLDDRRQALVFAQSQLLTFASPIDTRPVQGASLALTGLIEQLQAGASLLVTGSPPLALVAGHVTYVGTTVIVPLETPLMVKTRADGSSGETWWTVQTADGETLTVVSTAPDALSILSGDGKDIGNIPPSIAARFTRSTVGEMVCVSSATMDVDAGTTEVRLTAPLRLLYDRTTMAIYGNVAEITQGGTISEEVLGSGDGAAAFQSFMLKQAPLTFLLTPKGDIQPALSVSVSGLPWEQTPSLSQSGPADRHYQLTVDNQGRAQITFGDGIHGLRLTNGTDSVTATYRVGAGARGNVPARSLTRPPSGVGGLQKVLNPLAASGGTDGLSLEQMRRLIPLSVQDLRRIVTSDDFTTFLLNSPGIGQATVTTLPPQAGDILPMVLATVTGPGGTVPDPESETFISLENAVQAAMPVLVPNKVLPVRPQRFKLQAAVRAASGADLDPAQAAAAQALKNQYRAAAMQFDQAVLAADVEKILRSIPDLQDATVSALWIPAEESMTRHDILTPQPAEPGRGAGILSLSDDSDAVKLIPQTTAP